ncbi:hypothetical protein P8891_11330 [Bacillus atrophaeus]|uniref:hypothetical protein n=1 Tax=Bacillus atrophaeus TaxID=1452 RepID=UPI002281DF59|nr:hypothetical protein [Bacillus atrophaeus]MCY7947372.1 hypothetical protein [Bacillus atrophaeus]MCY8098692.1 hypothetical protein [Bacillus atrophaeus]MCY9167718.1 hypothetical protein [Bacillus atrophaeus]MEC0741654.1 hypothetical protein [Bacillus atrophaeus]MEC0745031.1 hypothetical protein [Bacillus atrophaeus]
MWWSHLNEWSVYLKNWLGIFGSVFSILSFFFIKNVQKKFKWRYERSNFRRKSKNDIIRQIQGIYKMIAIDGILDWDSLNDLTSHLERYGSLSIKTKWLNKKLRKKLLKLKNEPYFQSKKNQIMIDLKKLEHLIEKEADEILEFLT